MGPVTLWRATYLIAATPLYKRVGVSESCRTAREIDRGLTASATRPMCHAVSHRTGARRSFRRGGIVTRLPIASPSPIVRQCETENRLLRRRRRRPGPSANAIWGRLRRGAARPRSPYSIKKNIDAVDQRLHASPVFPPQTADTIEGPWPEARISGRSSRRRLSIPTPACSLAHSKAIETRNGLRLNGLTPPKTNWARPITDPPF